jgi:enoyl-CoA hydratase
LTVTYEEHGPVAVITMDRPEARNAIDGPAAEGIEAALDRLDADDDRRVAVLAAVGPVFCAGADLKEISAGRRAALYTARGGFAGVVRRDRTKPLIAAVDGPALAGGCEIVLACDLAVASRRATFGIPEAKRSLLAAAGGLHRMARAVPLRLAMELALTGDPVDADTAHRSGLVNAVVEPGEALPAALELAGRIAANAPLAVYAARRVLLGTLGMDDDGAFALTDAEARALWTTEDAAEGPRAFIEKRPPVWRGR